MPKGRGYCCKLNQELCAGFEELIFKCAFFKVCWCTGGDGEFHNFALNEREFPSYNKWSTFSRVSLWTLVVEEQCYTVGMDLTEDIHFADRKGKNHSFASFHE